jgi:hypothetical protein
MIEMRMNSAGPFETRTNERERKEEQNNRLNNTRETPTRGIEPRIIE